MRQNSAQFASRRSHCDSCLPESLCAPAVFPIAEACALALPSSGSEASPNVLDVVNLSNAWGYIAIPQKASIHKVALAGKVFNVFRIGDVCSQRFHIGVCSRGNEDGLRQRNLIRSFALVLDSVSLISGYHSKHEAHDVNSRMPCFWPFIGTPRV